VIAKNIHGLLAKRTRDRSREHRKAQQPPHTGKIDSRSHHRIFTIHSRRQRRDPGIGMRHIQTAKTLSLFGQREK